ncbi:MAG: hypothetical protein KatS3mg121_0553 [Gammaproteobacteria bacterium]|nr:MAG: hypothetical protein KatS3mg121_0553 [Gammaproteobacteria bacterium]
MSEGARIEPLGEGRLRVHGRLDAEQAGALLDALPWPAAAGPLEVDLSAVEAADSAGLALLLEWLGRARRRGVALRYRALPPGIEALARACQVLELLPRAD